MAKILVFRTILKKLKINYKDFKIITFHQDEIIKNNDMFFDEINNISLFGDKKVYFIEQANDKILETLDCIKSNDDELRFFIFSEQLDKKSKLRLFLKNHKLMQ